MRWFDGEAPGRVFVDVAAVSPAGQAQTKARFWLEVDDALQVARVGGEPPCAPQAAGEQGEETKNEREWSCPSCGAKTYGRFCRECGAKMPV